MSYPPLDDFEICPKCGADFDHKTPSYHYGCKSSTTAAGDYQVHDEWIKRVCPVCEFAWRESVWDGTE